MLQFRMMTAVLTLSATPALAAPNVVTDIPAIGSLVQQVMGDLGQPEVLLPPGGNAHDYQLRPSQATALQSADLLIWVGSELSPWLDRARSVTKGESVALLGLDVTHRQSYDNGEADKHDHEHGHELDHNGTDPHAWLDPENARQWLPVIAAKLAEKDPHNAAAYQENAARAADAVTATEAEISVMLAPVKEKNFVVFHDAYGYFTSHYGLKPAISVSLGDASVPSAARLSDIRKTIFETHPTCAFPEANHDPKLVATAIEGTGVIMGGALDPTGLTVEQGPMLYQNLLRSMGQTIADCLSKN